MSCRGCVTISDIPREGMHDYDDVVRMIENWSQVLEPQWIMLFGGEPLMHPQLKEIALQVRKHWPNARITIPTNALLLKKIIDLDWVRQVAPLEIRVSLHKNDDEGKFFKNLIKEFIASTNGGWKQNDLPFEIAGTPPSEDSPAKFNLLHESGLSIAVVQNPEYIVPYDYDDQGNIAPYNNDHQEAHKHCVSPELVYIYKHQLWKCLPYPNLRDTQPNFEQRWPSYKPFNYNDDLTDFFANVTKAEPLCSMCPTSGTLDHNNPATVKILPSIKWMEKNTK